ncbi:CRAL-TRIO domain-containing protein [Suillus fuscotomentosus]|uniref:CRAL-TRIO domain-containing protein n=1 Tax=Suillus fuscotomentosus TaxID=1912939 RepID=A0AAD4EK22_9AGAM|nr:CRAL-TRIO domain-containing protein [Suillus fuscotomentosus]KAG1906424.1 CRAL-TRIO domain-containing protein [Suillus fuscotomentosus]
MSLTPEEKETLEVFRKQVFDEEIIREGDSVGTDDATLLRFLRARKFNLTESKKMLQNCQQWRKTVGGDGIDALYARLDPYDYPEREEIFKSWSMYFHKTDKVCLMLFLTYDYRYILTLQKGRPVNIQFFGGLNLPKLYKHVTPERHWEAIVVNADSLTREVLPAASRAAGKHIHQSIVIVDLKGFGLSQFWQVKSLAQASFQISQDYFPETMGQLLIINAPSSFTFIWGIIKPWLAKETVEKVDILGSNYREVLLDVIDAENLPEILGGTCTCKSEGGCDLSGAGPVDG